MEPIQDYSSQEQGVLKKNIIDKNERSQSHTNINSNRYVVMLKLYDMRRGEIFNLTAK